MSERHSLLKRAAVLTAVVAPLAACGLTSNWAVESLKNLKNCQRPMLDENSEAVNQASGSRYVTQLNEQNADGTITRSCNTNIDGATGERQEDVIYSDTKNGVQIESMSQKGPHDTDILMIKTPHVMITASNIAPLDVKIRP